MENLNSRKNNKMNKNNKINKNIVLAVLGFIIVAAGILGLNIITDPEGWMKALPFILIGVGCGMFGYGTGELLSDRVKKKNPEIARQTQIAENDERNITIGNMAKAKGYTMSIYVMGALVLIFSLMEVPLIAVLIFIAAYLFLVGYTLYWHFRYDRKM